MKHGNTLKLNALIAYAEFIIEELKNPFSIKTKSFEEISALDVLYKTNGESFASPRKDNIVNAQIVNTGHD